MTTFRRSSALLAVALTLAAASVLRAAVPSTLNYQGRVAVDGVNFAGTGEFKFALVDGGGDILWRNDGTVAAGEPATAVALTVTSGLYATLLGDTAVPNMAALPTTVFSGAASDLRLRVWFRSSGAGAFQQLAPDTRLAAAPFAFTAKTVDASVYTAGLNGAGRLGTTDATPLTLQVNSAPIARFGLGNGTSLALGSAANTIGAATVGATIAGGGTPGNPNTVTGSYSAIGGGYSNSVGGSSAVVAGGIYNRADGLFAVVGGGAQNVVSGNYSVVPGGAWNSASGFSCLAAGNRAQALHDGCFVWSDVAGSGFASTAANQFAIQAAGGVVLSPGTTLGTATASPLVLNYNGATIARFGAGAGDSILLGTASNTMAATSGSSVLGGGSLNSVNATYAVLAGGVQNQANGSISVVAGGSNNFANGSGSMCVGGAYNTAAGDYSFAAGVRAKANHSGSFVWADLNAADFATTGNNQFLVRASGGTRIHSNSAATVGVLLNSGSGAWTTVSDRHAKENFTPVDPLAILAKVAALPVSTWNYKTQDAAIRHIGPMAQDFKAAFLVGETDTGITTIDADGVALAAIQGVNLKLEQEIAAVRAESAAKQAQLAAENAALQAALAELRTAVAQLQRAR